MVVVTVCPVGFDGGVGVVASGSAELTVLNATPSTPIAITALAPIPAETSLKFLIFTSNYPQSVSTEALTEHVGPMD